MYVRLGVRYLPEGSLRGRHGLPGGTPDEEDPYRLSVVHPHPCRPPSPWGEKGEFLTEESLSTLRLPIELVGKGVSVCEQTRPILRRGPGRCGLRPPRQTRPTASTVKTHEDRWRRETRLGSPGGQGFCLVTLGP